MAKVKVLSVSDRVSEIIYSMHLRERFSSADLVISCGDLPYYYVEYIVSALDVPVFYVRGNHARVMEVSASGQERTSPQGAIDIHNCMIEHRGILMAGIEGSIRYKDGPYQYTQSQMWLNVFGIVPSLFKNRMVHGRYLDIFVTHAPPWKIQDKEDWPHQGVKAFRWLLEVFKPRVHYHGHIHLYGHNDMIDTQFGSTHVMNTYGHRFETLDLPVYTPPVKRNHS